MSFLSATLELAFTRQFHMETVEVGMTFALTSFIQLLFCPIAGWIADRYATKAPMVVGLGLLSGSLLMLGPSPLFGIEPNLPLQLLALCVLGCGVSLAVIPTFVDQIKSTAHLGVTSQPVIAGLSTSVFSLGEVLGPFVGRESRVADVVRGGEQCAVGAVCDSAGSGAWARCGRGWYRGMRGRRGRRRAEWRARDGDGDASEGESEGISRGCGR